MRLDRVLCSALFVFTSTNAIANDTPDSTLPPKAESAPAFDELFEESVRTDIFGSNIEFTYTIQGQDLELAVEVKITWPL